jgi:hypothetical protein
MRVSDLAHPVRAFRLRPIEDKSENQISAPEQVAPSAEPAEAAEMPFDPPVISEPSADSKVALELALWESVKDGGPAELKAYLGQYPGGTFAALARTRLEASALSSANPAAPPPAEAAGEALDLAFWNSVKDCRRREEIEAYLAQHPDGHFAELARARLSSPEVT